MDALRKRGVKAAALNLSESREAILQTYDLMRKGELKLLWVFVFGVWSITADNGAVTVRRSVSIMKALWR